MKQSIPPYRAGGALTLTEALDYAAKRPAIIRFFDNQGQIIAQASYKELRQQALQLAAHLKDSGIERGSYIALIAETRIEFNALFFACQYAGLIPCPLPFTILPAGREAYEQKLCQFLHVLKPALLISPASIEAVAKSVGETCGVRSTTYEAISIAAHHTPELENYPQTSLKADELAYVQFSSGSTAEPSGLVITQQALMANLNLIATAGNSVIEEEQTFSWLPFDHNMGLVSFVLSPVNTQSNADYISPATFMGKPELWLELMSSCQSTLTFAPAFAYSLALQKRDTEKHLDLSALRIAGIGGDMAHPDILKTFAEAMQACGFRYEAFSTGYGLAEAVMAIAITRPETTPITYTITDNKNTQDILSCGEILPGFEIKFKNETLVNTAHTPQSIGELWVKGPSIVTRSLNADEKLEQDEQGFISTGDLGFIDQGQLFITGRAKDIIIIRGKNIWAQDVEWAITRSDERLEKQGMAAIGIAGNDGEKLVVLVQNERFDQSVRAELSSKILQTIKQNFGVTAQVFWTAPNQLSTTSVGKLARAQIKQNFINGSIAMIST